MPELKSAEDLLYLKRAFMLDSDEARATAAFKKLIFASMNDSRRRIGMRPSLLTDRRVLMCTDLAPQTTPSTFLHIVSKRRSA